MPNFRFPGVLNSQELLVAEAIQARAWQVIWDGGHYIDERADRAKLGGIVVRLMSDRSKSISDLASAAVAAFKRQHGKDGDCSSST
ncbi:hypothetical protein [Bosea sp. 124]|uniref:hypothetical protein n=1 Tax=Bosea sp. 124 TaxID=2135642 RepID=UPI000D3B2DBC|nr:hypothetical protein [Bosea sp. 124]PTM39596.1 hypothetical protein C8D03_1100 [Bosea sp. 124]